MTFDEWWDSLPNHIQHGPKAQMRLAWDAAYNQGVEAAARLFDDMPVVRRNIRRLKKKAAVRSRHD